MISGFSAVLPHIADPLPLIVATSTASAATGIACLAGFRMKTVRAVARGMMNASRDGIAIIRRGRLVFANDRFLTMIGRDRANDPKGEELGHLMKTREGTPIDEIRDDARVILKDGREADLAVTRIAGRSVLTITEVRRRPAQIDSLTGLMDRGSFERTLDRAIERANRDGRQIALLTIDLDRFKTVNDVFGHAAGDEALVSMSTILKGEVRATDTVARIGGDEFAIIQEGAEQPAGAQNLVKRMRATIDRIMDVSRNPIAVDATIGIALLPDDAETAGGLRRASDIALYQGKSHGPGTVRFFDERMDAETKQRRTLEKDLRQAVRRGEMELDYQPLVASHTGARTGYEALIRWRRSDGVRMAPAAFLAVAEETGAIVDIGRWALERACRDAATWNPDLTVSVNMSAVQLRMPGFPDHVRRILADTGLEPERLEIDVSEEAIASDRKRVIATLRETKALGVRIAIDDFGSGITGIGALREFPFDAIKIDRSFVAEAENDVGARGMIGAIAEMGRSLGVTVLAKGIETEAQRAMVMQIGCGTMQGFLYGRPDAVANDAAAWKKVG